MYFSSIHMMSETTGWGAGKTEAQKKEMSATQEWSLFHTTDGGCRWKVVKQWELPGSTPFFPLFLSETTVWVAMGHHLAHTSNAGTLWKELALPLATGSSAVISHLTFLDARTGWLIARIHHSSVLPKSAPVVALFHTDDGGTNWRQLPMKNRLVSEENASFPQGMTFLTATTGWIIAGSQLLMTRDGGRTWQPQALPLPVEVRSQSGLSFRAPRFFSALDGVLPACVNDRPDRMDNGFLVFVTHDGGQTWQSRPFVPKDFNQEYEQRSRMMEEKRVKEMKSGEGIPIRRDLAGRMTLAPQFTDMQFGWVGWPSLGMFTTTDSGEHWEPLELDLPPQEVSVIQFINSSVGWKWMRGNDVFSTQLCKTTDGGKTWTPLIPVTL